MNDLENKFLQVINKIFLNKTPEKIAIGVSGGIDSMALIFLFKKYSLIKNIKFIAIIIDHKLRHNSFIEAKNVANFLAKNNIDNKILESYLSQTPNSNIEANLREVRYNLLNNYCFENKINYLAIGHHESDVAENFLIRLFRGSGIDGLSATDYITKFKEIKIVRPLLDFKKEDLEKYLQENNIKFFEDESNKDEKYLRNKIRNFINSLEDKDLINNRIALASKSILENKKIIDHYLLKNAENILEFSDLGYILLKKKQFCELFEEKAKKYLAYILMQIGGNFYKPRLKKLENLYFSIKNDLKFTKKTFYGCVIEEFDDEKLIFYREKAKIKTAPLQHNFIWDNRFKIEFNGNIEGIKVDKINAEEFNKLQKKYNIKTNLSGVLKNIIYTLPVLRENCIILTIPHLNYCINEKTANNIFIKYRKNFIHN
jgi:tRNA(Ile)-lysidine synthase